MSLLECLVSTVNRTAGSISNRWHTDAYRIPITDAWHPMPSTPNRSSETVSSYPLENEEDYLTNHTVNLNSLVSVIHYPQYPQ